ncbi:MAG: hypothetical protein IJU37_08720 [Desulfovibrio sp.]|nr:hypothetical protein [Desulfovibrio sp.]
MRKIIVFTLALMLGTISLSQAGQQDFTLVNDTGRPICDVYISPDNARDWQEDLLRNDKYCLPSGESIDISFDRSFRGVKMWDMRIVDDKGNETIYEDFNLMQISNIRLRRNGTAEYW